MALLGYSAILGGLLSVVCLILDFYQLTLSLKIKKGSTYETWEKYAKTTSYNIILSYIVLLVGGPVSLLPFGILMISSAAIINILLLFYTIIVKGFVRKEDLALKGYTRSLFRVTIASIVVGILFVLDIIVK